MAKNVKMSVKGTVLTLVMDLDAPAEPSKTGKSEIVGSTSGFLDVPGAPGVRVSVNLIKNKAA